MTTNVHLVFGEDEYLVSAKARTTVESLVPQQDRALSLEIVDGKADTVDQAIVALGKCLEGVQTLGFFGNRKVVWFRDVNFLYDSNVGRSESVKERVNGLAAVLRKGMPEGTTLVLSATKVDKRYALFKACKDAGEVSEFSYSDKMWELEKQVKDRLVELLRKLGIRMPESVRDSFLAKVGTDTRQIVNELEKLAVYMGDRKDVGQSDVDAVTAFSSTAPVWDLADAVGRRNLSGALSMLRQLMFQNESHIAIVIGIESRIRELMVFREAIDRGWLKEQPGRHGDTLSWSAVPPAVDKEFGEAFQKDPRSTHPYRARLLAQQAGGFTRGDLRRCQKAIVDAHVKLVSSSAPKSIVLELLLVDMLRPRKAVRLDKAP